jgi:hypothetical protein
LKGAKKKRGRSPKPERERRSKTRTFRVRGRLDEYLVWNAGESGRSVSEEIEARLERSFYMDGVLTTLAGDAAPLVNALAMAVAFTYLQELTRQDRYQVMQVATGYIVAAFGSLHNQTMGPRPKVSDMRWPPSGGMLDGYELEGLRLAHTVLKNLGHEMPADQTAELAEILRTKEREIEGRKLTEARAKFRRLTGKLK